MDEKNHLLLHPRINPEESDSGPVVVVEVSMIAILPTRVVVKVERKGEISESEKGGDALGEMMQRRKLRRKTFPKMIQKELPTRLGKERQRTNQKRSAGEKNCLLHVRLHPLPQQFNKYN